MSFIFIVIGFFLFSSRWHHNFIFLNCDDVMDIHFTMETLIIRSESWFQVMYGSNGMMSSKIKAIDFTLSFFGCCTCYFFLFFFVRFLLSFHYEYMLPLQWCTLRQCTKLVIGLVDLYFQYNLWLNSKWILINIKKKNIFKIILFHITMGNKFLLNREKQWKKKTKQEFQIYVTIWEKKLESKYYDYKIIRENANENNPMKMWK